MKKIGINTLASKVLSNFSAINHQYTYEDILFNIEYLTAEKIETELEETLYKVLTYRDPKKKYQNTFAYSDFDFSNFHERLAEFIQYRFTHDNCFVPYNTQYTASELKDLCMKEFSILDNIFMNKQKFFVRADLDLEKCNSLEEYGLNKNQVIINGDGHSSAIVDLPSDLKVKLQAYSKQDDFHNLYFYVKLAYDPTRKINIMEAIDLFVRNDDQAEFYSNRTDSCIR